MSAESAEDAPWRIVFAWLRGGFITGTLIAAAFLSLFFNIRAPDTLGYIGPLIGALGAVLLTSLRVVFGRWDRNSLARQVRGG
jgi:hypothetical protein